MRARLGEGCGSYNAVKAQPRCRYSVPRAAMCVGSFSSRIPTFYIKNTSSIISLDPSPARCSMTSRRTGPTAPAAPSEGCTRTPTGTSSRSARRGPRKPRGWPTQRRPRRSFFQVSSVFFKKHIGSLACP